MTTLHQLSSARLVLERARILLRDHQEETQAYGLLVAVCDVIHSIAVAEAEGDLSEASWLIARAQMMVEQTRGYAAARHLYFLVVLTPDPDTAVMRSDEVLSAIASMRASDTIPPPSVQERIVEAHLAHDTIPCPMPNGVTSED
jgi:hypothetical protein